jgi:AAA15 family ATPase/GTPase
VLVAPLDNLLELLKQSISIGPIRKIIDANYQPLPYIEQKDWYDGSAAWSYLEKAELDVLKKINTWMMDEDKLDLGYGIALKKTQSIIQTFDISETSLLLDENNELQIKVKGNPALSSPISENKHHYTIIDKYNHISVTPSEVGTGVSQLMPLIIAAVSQQGGIVGCEQPELHLHPRIQVAIADLLTQHIGKVNYLIETHSEHLILRLLKRIRQHTDKELPEGLEFIQKSDVAIIYLEPTENGVIAHKIGIDEDGEFTENWPHDFFSERRQELI